MWHHMICRLYLDLWSSNTGVMLPNNGYAFWGLSVRTTINWSCRAARLEQNEFIPILSPLFRFAHSTNGITTTDLTYWIRHSTYSIRHSTDLSSLFAHFSTASIVIFKLWSQFVGGCSRYFGPPQGSTYSKYLNSFGLQVWTFHKRRFLPLCSFPRIQFKKNKQQKKTQNNREHPQ